MSCLPILFCPGLRIQDQVEKRVPLTKHRLSEAIDNIRGAVMICYPMGLPEWDFVRQALEATEDLAGTSVGQSFNILRVSIS